MLASFGDYAHVREQGLQPAREDKAAAALQGEKRLGVVCLRGRIASRTPCLTSFLMSKAIKL